MPAKLTALVVALGLVVGLGQAHARHPARQRQALLDRARLVRGTIQLHRQMRASSTPVHVSKSSILPDAVATAKKYGDSWTCRSSTELLIKRLAASGLRLKLDSAGKGAFDWGREGKVSYHYFGVDSTSRPKVLLDPTATTNFGRDVQPGGMMLGLLERAGQQQGAPRAARRVARRIARGGIGGLLVLGNASEIAVYRQALEDAARKQARVRRNAERSRVQGTFRPVQ
jgi:hypothetical protein